jgi:hypothetical protein
VTFLNVSDKVATLNLAREDYGLSALINQLSRAGVEVADLSIQKPTLESVFLKLTGRELRD